MSLSHIFWDSLAIWEFFIPHSCEVILLWHHIFSMIYFSWWSKLWIVFFTISMVQLFGKYVNLVFVSLHVICKPFLAHQSWKLKWAFLIVCPSVYKLLQFRLLQNQWTNFNQTWHKSSLGGGESKFFKWRGLPFSKGRK
jgi:hypothetical protein